MADDMKAIEKPRAEVIIERFKGLVSGRQSFESYWQSLHDLFYIESPDINASYSEGSELNVANLYDSTTLETADVLASGFMNYLTPATSKWFRLRHKDPALAENKTVNDYLESVADEIYNTLNNSNFYDSILPCYKSSGVYGTSILLEEEDYETEARFTVIPIKEVCIVEDAYGRIKEYYIEFEYTAYQAMTRWGKDKLSDEMKKELETRSPDKKHKFILYIAQRHRRMVGRSNKENMPIEASWIDVEAKKTIDEGGYNEFPAMCHRFDKRPHISWGFSPAMKSLPFARMLNAIAKTSLRAMMKHTDPPMAVPDNAFIMPLNFNPRAMNYYKKNVLENGSKDAFPLGNYGNPQVAQEAIEYYTKKVKSLMYNDVFLAFDGLEKQMNNPEVMERINEKMTLLGPAVGRFTSEVLNPIIIRTIGILFRRGKLPKPPDELIQNPLYEIDYVSQLAQAQKRSQLNALVTALTMTGQMAQFAPEVLDKVDPDKTADEIWNITGAPVRVLRDDQEIETIRESRSQEQARQQELVMAQQAAMAGKDMAQGEKHLADAQAVGKGK